MLVVVLDKIKGHTMRFEDIIGNDTIKIQLSIASRASLIKNTSIPHILFTGSAGCGKTTMAKTLAIHHSSNFIKVPPETIKTSKDLFDVSETLCAEGYSKEGKIINKIRPTIIFFDEIHKMPLSGQEVLGIAMEEWYITSKNQYTGQICEYWLPKFTVVGATTLAGKLSKPFKDRFKLLFQFSTYDLEQSILIVKKHAELKNLKITDECAKAIACRARGVPRTIVSYLERAADAITVMGETTITSYTANSIFNIMGIDESGLSTNDIKLMKTLYSSGMPVGLDTLSVILDETQTTLLNNREPYLIQRGLIMRTGRGRVLTQAGIEYLRENKHIETRRKFSA